jgi:hypothetical protein
MEVKIFATDFLFVKDFGLRFSSATFPFRGDFTLKVSKNRDFLRAGEDDTDPWTPHTEGEVCGSVLTGFEVGV